MDRIEIDGSEGEGGGQVLRTALALSLAMRRDFRIQRIRARRDSPGLLRQHLTAVAAARAVSGAQARGERLGSSTLEFEPGPVRGGRHAFSIGTAGSTTLVLQAVLPALLTAAEPSTIEVEGGTHNPSAPPFDFFGSVLVPLLERMGPALTARLERHGFHPAGGGRITLDIRPAERLAQLRLVQRGQLLRRFARIRVANLSREIAEREARVLVDSMQLSTDEWCIEELGDASGPGNVITLELRSEGGTEVVTGFGRFGTPAERVARFVAERAHEFLAADVPIGPHLADQLLVPFALAGGGTFRTVAPTGHTRTTAGLVERFLEVDVAIEQESERAWRVDVRPRAATGAAL